MKFKGETKGEDIDVVGPVVNKAASGPASTKT